MKREIRSGELVNINCKYSYKDTIEPIEDEGRGISKSGNEKMDTPIHEDLKKAFMDVIPHFMLLCGQVEETKEIRNAIRDGVPENPLPTTSIFYPYDVTSFEIKGNGKHEGVQFKGTRILSNGDVLPLTSPKKNWENEEYPFIQELIEQVEHLKEEVYQYTEGKQAPPPPDPQQGLDFDALDIGVMGADDEMPI